MINKVDRLSGKLVVYLPDTRGAEISRYGYGNLKIGPDVYTYSRPPSRHGGTCPGSTDECEAICYAKRVTGPVREMWKQNDEDHVPAIPKDCKILRLHVSGDFDTVSYIDAWIDRLAERGDVTCWVYTRSWRVPHLLPALERLRKLPNVQVFASMDASCPDMPPAGWRRSWIEGDPRAAEDQFTMANATTFDGVASYVCPEQMGRKENCQECGYCFSGVKNDVTFLRH